MPSQLQSDTARANGARSRGPKTAATRAISSRNALRHGFTACSAILLKCENPDEFEEIVNGHFAMYQPSGPVQEALVDEMISAHWRIRRLRVVETRFVDLEIIRNKPEVERIYTQPDATVHLTEAFRTLIDDSRVLSLISRYESRLRRMHDRAYRTLRELQDVDPPSDLQRPEAGPPPPSEPGLKNDETNPAAEAPSPELCLVPALEAPEPKGSSRRRSAHARRSRFSAIHASMTTTKLFRRQ